MAKRKQVRFEYIIRSTPTILFEFLSEPAELGQWFADKVMEDKGLFTFEWDSYPEVAELIEWTENEKVKFLWLDRNNEFMEFQIQITDITHETVLIITDYCDEKGEKDLKLLWDQQIKTLVSRIGGR